MTLDKRLKYHISDAKKLNDKSKDNKLYRRMREVGLNNWEMVPLLVMTCDKKTIVKYEREWMNALCAD